MRVFVTGATGVVGRRLVPMLREAGHDVTGVARSRAGREQLERHGATAVQLDLFDPDAVRRAVHAHETVINLATHIPASSAKMLLPWAWRENDRLRRDASAIIAEASAAAGVSRLIQESFAPSYPDRGDPWIDETTPISPVRYSRTVADAERSAQRFSQRGGAGIVLRFGFFYGPDANHVRDFVMAIRKGWAPLPGRPEAYLSSVSHDDAAAAAAAAITLPAGVYNVVDDEPMTREAFFGMLADTLGVPPPKLLPAWVASLMGSLGDLMSRSLRISNRKFRSATSWAPKYPSAREGWPPVLAAFERTRLTGPTIARKVARR